MNKYASAPIKTSEQTDTTAQKNSPVLSSTQPVTTGTTMPAMFPHRFCIPVHLPAAAVPASVCVTAQRFELNRPKQNEAAIISHKLRVAFSTIALGIKMTANKASPPTTNVFRTCVGVPPARIQRSEAQPPKTAPAATNQNGSEPRRPIISSLYLRAFMKYCGSHVSRKYHP